MNLISIFTDISTDQSSELQKKHYKDMMCEHCTFHEEGTCEFIKLYTKICNERTMACKCNRILNSNIFPFLYARALLHFVLKFISLVYTVEMTIHVRWEKVQNLKSSIKKKMRTRSCSKEQKNGT